MPGGSGRVVRQIEATSGVRSPVLTKGAKKCQKDGGQEDVPRMNTDEGKRMGLSHSGFHVGTTSTSSNFGRRGSRPTTREPVIGGDEGGLERFGAGFEGETAMHPR